jgi:hypothetical protein
MTTNFYNFTQRVCVCVCVCVLYIHILSLQEGIYGQNSGALPRMRHSVTRITPALRCSSLFQGQ